jgi:hypothetical protein
MSDTDLIPKEHFVKVSLEDPAALIRHRRRVRMVRFIVCEAVTIAVMVGSAVAGISERFAAENFTPVFRVLPVSAAVVAVVLPIIFFGDPKRRSRPRRRDAKKASASAASSVSTNANRKSDASPKDSTG